MVLCYNVKIFVFWSRHEASAKLLILIIAHSLIYVNTYNNFNSKTSRCSNLILINYKGTASYSWGGGHIRVLELQEKLGEVQPFGSSSITRRMETNNTGKATHIYADNIQHEQNKSMFIHIQCFFLCLECTE